MFISAAIKPNSIALAAKMIGLNNNEPIATNVNKIDFF
jgi:hypothetical protein